MGEGSVEVARPGRERLAGPRGAVRLLGRGEVVAVLFGEALDLVVRGRREALELAGAPAVGQKGGAQVEVLLELALPTPLVGLVQRLEAVLVPASLVTARLGGVVALAGVGEGGLFLAALLAGEPHACGAVLPTQRHDAVGVEEEVELLRALRQDRTDDLLAPVLALECDRVDTVPDLP